MSDPRLKQCLDRWDGELPAAMRTEAERLQAYVIASAWRFVRGCQYKPDPGRDFWKTPTEFWTDRGGDCEDYAIAIGAMLKDLFVDMRLSLVLCWKLGTRQGHAVLCIESESGDIYLDNEYRVPYGAGEFKERYDEHSRTEWPG